MNLRQVTITGAGKPRRISSAVLRRTFAIILDDVRYNRRHYLVQRNGHPVALLSPVKETKEK